MRNRWIPRTDMIAYANNLLGGWGDALEQAFIPEDGSIVKRTRTITEEFKVEHQSDGTVVYHPIKQDGGKYEVKETSDDNKE